jgi:hypothetical protein
MVGTLPYDIDYSRFMFAHVMIISKNSTGTTSEPSTSDEFPACGATGLGKLLGGCRKLFSWQRLGLSGRCGFAFSFLTLKLLPGREWREKNLITVEWMMYIFDLWVC